MDTLHVWRSEVNFFVGTRRRKAHRWKALVANVSTPPFPAPPEALRRRNGPVDHYVRPKIAVIPVIPCPFPVGGVVLAARALQRKPLTRRVG